MAEEIGDFETENIIANFKFKLTNWTLDQYQSFNIVLQSEKKCFDRRCSKLQLSSSDSTQSLKELNHCSRDCEVGVQEVLNMQKKHTELARLTYSKNIQRCLSIYGNPSQTIESTDFNPTALAHCISHNTDKVDRRFFGYYNNQKSKLSEKYSFD